MKNIILHLSLIDKVGPSTIDKLVESFNKFKDKDLILDIYRFSLKDLIHYCGLKENTALLIYNGLKDKNLLEKELELIERNSIRFLTLFDQDYPSLLKEIYLPPSVLYIKSSKDFKFDNNSISVVGSRKNDDYGQRVLNSIIPQLVKNNYSIVSGGAYGIDSIAHQVCLNFNGKTIAVLGSGLLNLYPKENLNLFRDIFLNNGALISPFSLKTQASKYTFPARNRIISGLSLGCLIVQAKEKSGALITANYALDQAREVLAIPGQIDNSLSLGCHKLISQGAHIISNAQDILNIFGGSTLLNINNLENLTDISPDYNKILNLLSKPLSIDEILLFVNLSFDDLQELLFDMQIKGYINQNIIGLWYKV